MSDNNGQAPTESFKISMSSVVESDQVLFRQESSKFYKIVLFLIIGDFILSEFILVHDYCINTNIISICYVIQTISFFYSVCYICWNVYIFFFSICFRYYKLLSYT